MLTDAPSSVYVLDTHALQWYWSRSARLGGGASAAFRALELRQAVGVVPLIVIAELHYVSVKLRHRVAVDDIVRRIDASPALRLEGLTRRHLTAFSRLEDIPEMHDRLIAAVALVHGAPLVSRDSVLREHPVVQVVW